MREAEVAALVAQGMTNRQIATALFGSSVLQAPQGGLVYLQMPIQAAREVVIQSLLTQVEGIVELLWKRD